MLKFNNSSKETRKPALHPKYAMLVTVARFSNLLSETNVPLYLPRLQEYVGNTHSYHIHRHLQ